MTAYALAALGGMFVAAPLLAFIGLRARRRSTRWAYVGLAFLSLVAAGAYVLSQGAPDGVWGRVLQASYVSSHALVPVLVFAVAPGRLLDRARPLVFGLLAISPAFALVPAPPGWAARLGFQATGLGAYLGLCLGLAFALSLTIWLSRTLLSSEAFWLIVATFVLIDAGPILSFELEVTGFEDPGAINIAMPLSLAAFALFIMRTNPLPIPGGRGRSKASPSDRPEFLVMDEERPKYIERLAQRDAASGRKVLVLERGTVASVPSEGPVARAEIRPTPRAALLLWATALEFFRRHERGLLVVKDLAAIAALSGWARTADALRELRRVTRSRGPSVVLATTCLRVEERESLRKLGVAWWRLPNPAHEIETILVRSVGPVADTVLDAFAHTHAIPPRLLGVEHIEALAAFLQREIRELASGLADTRNEDGIVGSLTGAINELGRFRTRSPEDLARGMWPSRVQGGMPETGILVTANRYWHGAEPTVAGARLLAAGTLRTEGDPTEGAFVEPEQSHGESLLISGAARLDGESRPLERPALGRLSEVVSAHLALLADAIDLPLPRYRFKRDIETLCRTIERAPVG
jgi:hypothetical protein